MENHQSSDENKISVDSVVDKFIIKPTDVVSILAKDVDLDYPTRDTFQTDTAISKCNGSMRVSGGGGGGSGSGGGGGRLEDRELEPWDGLGGLNGESDMIELDGNANGWDANEMFSRNEAIYGVQSTFDQSLSGYTIPLQKDTQEFKEQEAVAEKIAQEIENASGYRERLELENGDEEQKYAAVERNIPLGESVVSGGADGGQSIAKTHPPGKFVPPPKRKPQQAQPPQQQQPLSNSPSVGKPTMVRPVPPPSIVQNNGNHATGAQPQQQQQQAPPPSVVQQQNTQVSLNKNNNYQPMQMQSHQQQQTVVQQVVVGGGGPPQYTVHGSPATFSHIHSQPPPSITAKINGENNNNNVGGGKPLPQRIRQYPTTATPVTFTEPPPSLPQQVKLFNRPFK